MAELQPQRKQESRPKSSIIKASPIIEKVEELSTASSDDPENEDETKSQFRDNVNKAYYSTDTRSGSEESEKEDDGENDVVINKYKTHSHPPSVSAHKPSIVDPKSAPVFKASRVKPKTKNRGNEVDDDSHYFEQESVSSRTTQSTSAIIRDTKTKLGTIEANIFKLITSPADVQIYSNINFEETVGWFFKEEELVNLSGHFVGQDDSHTSNYLIQQQKQIAIKQASKNKKTANKSDQYDTDSERESKLVTTLPLAMPISLPPNNSKEKLGEEKKNAISKSTTQSTLYVRESDRSRYKFVPVDIYAKSCIRVNEKDASTEWNITNSVSVRHMTSDTLNIVKYTFRTNQSESDIWAILMYGIERSYTDRLKQLIRIESLDPLHAAIKDHLYDMKIFESYRREPVFYPKHIQLDSNTRSKFVRTSILDKIVSRAPGALEKVLNLGRRFFIAKRVSLEDCTTETLKNANITITQVYAAIIEQCKAHDRDISLHDILTLFCLIPSLSSLNTPNSSGLSQKRLINKRNPYSKLLTSGYSSDRKRRTYQGKDFHEDPGKCYDDEQSELELSPAHLLYDLSIRSWIKDYYTPDIHWRYPERCPVTTMVNPPFYLRWDDLRGRVIYNRNMPYASQSTIDTQKIRYEGVCVAVGKDFFALPKELSSSRLSSSSRKSNPTKPDIDTSSISSSEIQNKIVHPYNFKDYPGFFSITDMVALLFSFEYELKHDKRWMTREMFLYMANEGNWDYMGLLLLLEFTPRVIKKIGLTQEDLIKLGWSEKLAMDHKDVKDILSKEVHRTLNKTNPVKTKLHPLTKPK